MSKHIHEAQISPTLTSLNYIDQPLTGETVNHNTISYVDNITSVYYV